MSTILTLGSKGPGSTDASTTSFYAAVDGFIGGGVNTTEAFLQITYRSAGTLSNMYIRIIENDRGVSTLTSRINGANGAQSISIGASSTGEFEDTTNTDTITAGDEVNYQIVTGAGGTVFRIFLISSLFAASTNTVGRFGAVTLSGIITAASSNFYQSFSGDTSTSSTLTETNIQHRIKAAATAQNLFVYISVNARTTSTTATFRNNGANGNLTVSIGGGLTGIFEDTTNTDSLAIDDLVNYVIVTGTGTENFTTRIISVELSTTNNTTHFINGDADGVTQSANLTNYYTIAGTISGRTTETDTLADANFIFNASNLECNISANSVTAASTLTFRKNSAAGNQSISIGSSTTGIFEDITNTDSIIASDEINYQLITGATGTSLTLRSMGILGIIPPPLNWKTLLGAGQG